MAMKVGNYAQKEELALAGVACCSNDTSRIEFALENQVSRDLGN